MLKASLVGSFKLFYCVMGKVAGRVSENAL